MRRVYNLSTPGFGLEGICAAAQRAGKTDIFNDMQENIEKEAFIAYVGPEHFEEGATCAYLAAQKIAEMKEICVLASDGNSEKYLLGRRISGFIKNGKGG